MPKLDKITKGKFCDGVEKIEKNHIRTLQPAGFRREGKICIKSRAYIDFSSNDYLGLSSHPKLKEASVKAAEQLGTSSSASRLLSGDLELHHQLEQQTAAFKQKEAVLVFNSGYQANVGIIAAFFKKGDVIFSNKLNHASIIDGILLSGAKLFRFNHNNVSHLEHLLKAQRGKYRNSLIITETIFSMDGDKAPIKDIMTLKEKHNCWLMVDEAHATGVFGKNGSGIVEEEGLACKIEIIMGTFSKALGSFGAYVACSGKIKDYLINKCRSFIYSTALPPSVIAANLTSLDLIKEEAFRRRELLINADYFRDELQKKGFITKGSSQIIPLIIGENEKCIRISNELKKRGYWALPIRPPTVPVNEARIRFSLTYNHKREMLAKLVEDLCGIM